MSHPSETPESVHRPVLLNEVLEWLAPRPGMVFVDGTVGAGGHARALAERVLPGGRVLGLDRDASMLALAERNVEGLPVELLKVSYSDLELVFREQELDVVDGIVLDLGLSSDQLSWSERGFSFKADGPLDMRFNSRSGAGATAADVVAQLDADELSKIFHEYGEERFARRIARRIVEERAREPIKTTGRLAEIVRKCVPGKHGPIDPATRVFQALRIYVNDELEQLDHFLAIAADYVRPGGRVAIISFHSLEDRKVKWAFRDDPIWEVLTRKPVTAGDEELAANPRARSAKLRVAERCPDLIGPPTPPGLRQNTRPTSRPRGY